MFLLSEVRSGADLGSSTLLYIVQEVGVLVCYIAEILVGLRVGNPSWTSSSSLFSAEYPMGPASTRAAEMYHKLNKAFQYEMIFC
jgi:hypothetical protein